LVKWLGLIRLCAHAGIKLFRGHVEDDAYQQATDGVE
jgi:hypothetical protein